MPAAQERREEWLEANVELVSEFVRTMHAAGSLVSSWRIPLPNGDELSFRAVDGEFAGWWRSSSWDPNIRIPELETCDPEFLQGRLAWFTANPDRHATWY